MGRRIGLVLVVAALAALFSLPDFRAVERDTARSEIARAPYAAAVQGKIEKTYRTWLASHERAGAERFLTLSLGWSRGLSSEDPGATGLARFDLVGGIADIELERLPAGSSWDVWVVDNVEGPGRSALPEEGDRMHRLGRLDEAGGRSHLRAPVPLDLARSLDVVVVTRAGDRPERRPVLFGSPMLFQRLAAGTAAAPQPDQHRPAASGLHAVGAGARPSPTRRSIASTRWWPRAPTSSSTSSSAATAGPVAPATRRRTT